jgi:hypothetical protein
MTFKVTFIANRQLSARTVYLQDDRRRIIFSFFFNPFNGPDQRKILYESNLPIYAEQLFLLFRGKIPNADEAVPLAGGPIPVAVELFL